MPLGESMPLAGHVRSKAGRPPRVRTRHCSQQSAHGKLSIGGPSACHPPSPARTMPCGDFGRIPPLRLPAAPFQRRPDPNNPGAVGFQTLAPTSAASVNCFRGSRRLAHGHRTHCTRSDKRPNRPTEPSNHCSKPPGPDFPPYAAAQTQGQPPNTRHCLPAPGQTQTYPARRPGRPGRDHKGLGGRPLNG